MDILSQNGIKKIFNLIKNKFYILSLEPINEVITTDLPTPDAVSNAHIVTVTLPRNIKNLYACVTTITPALVPSIQGFSGNQVSVQVLRMSGYTTITALNRQTAVSIISSPPYGARVAFRLTGLVEYE